MVLSNIYQHKKLHGVISYQDYDTRTREIDKSLEGFREFHVLKDNFVALLFLYNIKDNRLKVLRKLSPNKKYGFLSEYLIKCCRTIGVPKLIIEKYDRAKASYHYGNKYYRDDLQKRKDELSDITRLLTFCCIDEWSKSKIRDKKLEQIL